MRTIIILFLSVMLTTSLQAQTTQVPDKVQFQSVRVGIGMNTNYQGSSTGSLSRLFIGYYIDQSKSWGISPFVNGGVYYLSHLNGTDSAFHNSTSLGFEPGLLSGYQNDKIGIKLLTSINLVFNKLTDNGIMVIPVIGLNIGNGAHPIGKRLVASAYAAVSPFQGGTPGFVFGINLGLRLRPITYVRVAP